MQLTPEQKADALKELERLKAEKQQIIVKANETLAFYDGKISIYEAMLNEKPSEQGPTPVSPSSEVADSN